MVTKRRKVRQARTARRVGSLVRVNVRALDQALAENGMNPGSLATAVVNDRARQKGMSEVRRAQDHDSIRKAVGQLRAGKQARVHMRLLDEISRALKIQRQRLIAEERAAQPEQVASQSKIQAQRLAIELEARDVSREAMEDLPRDLERLLDFDAWHHALGTSAVPFNDPRLDTWRSRFARSMASAMSVLFAPLEKAGRSFDYATCQTVFRVLLEDRDQQTNARLNRVNTKGNIDEHVSGAVENLLREFHQHSKDIEEDRDRGSQ